VGCRIFIVHLKLQASVGAYDTISGTHTVCLLASGSEGRFRFHGVGATPFRVLEAPTRFRLGRSFCWAGAGDTNTFSVERCDLCLESGESGGSGESGESGLRPTMCCGKAVCDVCEDRIESSIREWRQCVSIAAGSNPTCCPFCRFGGPGGKSMEVLHMQLRKRK
jgi:hypothetical protein